jgi:hypothetical protein
MINCLHFCLPEFFRASSVSTFPNRISPTFGQKKGRRRMNSLFVCLWSNFSRRTVLGAGVFRGGGTSPMEPHYNCQHSRVYAHYTAIVQSSGMGKSRTVDELGKTHFVIPINLRDSHSTGDVYSLFVLISINLSSELLLFDCFQGFPLPMTKCETF